MGFLGQWTSRKRTYTIKEIMGGYFYQKFLFQLNEEAFSELFAELPSRPKLPIKLLVGLEALKVGNGWNDVEMRDSFFYNLQVCYAPEMSSPSR
ncbi:MAG: hypothetical protein WCG34_00625 [Leptolinea sp.]